MTANYMLKKQENGRSMIEMLGVLAVIGVLSVGAVYGYTIAMNKHRANELLHEASKRAVVCVAQISAGNTPSVSDFDDYDGYSFTAAPVTGQNKFTITISGKEISETVCNNMKNALPSTVQMTTPENCENVSSMTLTYEDGTGGESAPVCAKNGEACTSSADCCDDNCNSSGYCGDDGCKPNGTWGVPPECCSGIAEWNTGNCVSCVENGHELYSGRSAADCCSGQAKNQGNGICDVKPECIPNGEQQDLWPGITCCSGTYAIPGSMGYEMPTCVGCITEGYRGFGSCCEGLLQNSDGDCVSCLGNGKGECHSDADCCSGYQCNARGYCSVKPACISEYGTLSEWPGLSCCEGLINDGEGCVPAPHCAPEGEEVDEYSPECCDGLFQNGL